MNFTFGIITDGRNDDRLRTIVSAIENERIPNYEIVIVGNSGIKGGRIVNHPFDESQKKSWITRKKNIVTERATYDNVVYMHDYITILPGWYKGFQDFGTNFAVCMNQILNFDGSRFRDWTLWPGDIPALNAASGLNLDSHDCILPYDVTNLSKFQYISGAYFVAKKAVMQTHRFDENLSWGEGEDVYWSYSIKNAMPFSMNVNSKVQLLKSGKNVVFKPVPPESLPQLRAVVS